MALQWTVTSTWRLHPVDRQYRQFTALLQSSSNQENSPNFWIKCRIKKSITAQVHKLWIRIHTTSFNIFSFRLYLPFHSSSSWTTWSRGEMRYVYKHIIYSIIMRNPSINRNESFPRVYIGECKVRAADGWHSHRMVAFLFNSLACIFLLLLILQRRRFVALL